MEPFIAASALRMSGDQDEARELAHLTVLKALDAPPRDGDEDGPLETRLWMYGLLRSVFHSVERQRRVRRERGFTVAAERATTEAAKA